MMYPFPLMGQEYRPAVVSFDELVLRIKRGQRASNEWKQRWWKWCEGNGKVRDPTKYTYDQLVQGLATCGDPPRGPPLNENKKTLTKDGVVYTRVNTVDKPQFNRLVSIIKDGQRTDPAWRASWSKFCETSGKGTYDPSKHPLEFLQYAIRQIGNPPKTPSSQYVGSAQSGRRDPMTAKIIATVKSLQKSSPSFKAAYMTHCDTHAGGIRDPARHSSQFLNNFISMYKNDQSRLEDNLASRRAPVHVEDEAW
eukprot:TRINITY_DN32152_c0_g1_i1.p1 TRINITY_DN32152_c0_g1~~TRINITY_DN32152_c0_g1_i1.p1  ORF type:complete len:252 (+),score=38.13 TRINITY_DN32152_c0_g1_i1:94-849(+)